MPGFFSAWLSSLRRRVRLSAMESREVCGFPVDVENSRFDIETQTVVTKLEAALQTIQQFDPRRFRRLRSDIHRLWVVRYPCRGAFFPDQRICMVELTFLARPDMTPAQVAASIVHEGAHARLFSARVKRERLTPAREERFCRRAEVAFAHTLPVELAAPVLSRAEGAIEGSDDDAAPTIDWHEAARRQREADIQALPVPPWLKRVLLHRVARERSRSTGAG